MKFAIAHAQWADGRSSTLKRLVDQLTEQGAKDIHVSVSGRREHAAIWATRLWEYCDFVQEHVVLLNDDVILHPQFVTICQAMVSAIPDESLSLHTNIPGADRAQKDGHHWVRSYWYTGPAVIVAPGHARKWLDWPAPWALLSQINEDNRAIHAAWEEQRPFYCSVPAIVMHDTATKSTLGYDDMPNRVPTVPWNVETDDDLTDPETWRYKVEPPHVVNYWMTPERLNAMRSIQKSGRPFCVMCSTLEGVVGNKGGVSLCQRCIGNCHAAMVQAGAR